MTLHHIRHAASIETLASRTPSGGGLEIVTDCPWPDGTQLATTTSFMTAHGIVSRQRPGSPTETSRQSTKTAASEIVSDAAENVFVDFALPDVALWRRRWRWRWIIDVVVVGFVKCCGTESDTSTNATDKQDVVQS
jgi:hypothetical protein